VDIYGNERSRVLDLTGTLSELVDLMLTAPSAETLLDDLARLAAGVIAPAAACSVTLRHDSRPQTVASSDALAAQADEAQYVGDEGPCLQALRTGEVVGVPDLVTEHRWDTYRPHALGCGIRSSLSLPLNVEGDTRGALNLYATVPDAFGNGGRQRAEVFAAQASAALTVVARHARQTEMTAQLRSALASRTVIDQALGIIMDQQRCGADRAFELLRSASQHQNRKLREIAKEIVRAVGGEEPRPGPFHEPSPAD
jgi:GAF domain-containing protein